MKNFLLAIGNVDLLIVEGFIMPNFLRKRGPIVQKGDYFFINLIDFFRRASTDSLRLNDDLTEARTHTPRARTHSRNLS
jgi:hypothetical protein